MTLLLWCAGLALLTFALLGRQPPRPAAATLPQTPSKTTAVARPAVPRMGIIVRAIDRKGAANPRFAREPLVS